MKKNKTLQKRFMPWIILLIVSILIIAACFCLHCYNVNEYNDTVRTISGTYESDENGVSVNIHPRGEDTDIWDKEDEVLGTKLTGAIFEVTVTNDSAVKLQDWLLTINMKDKGFVNNAWCGTVEIQQNTDDGKKVQTLDLRSCDKSKIALEHHISGSDIMIDFKPGDALVYHPCTADDEMPLESHSSVSAGIILYSYSDSGDLDLADCTFEYHLHKEYLDKSDAYGYLIALIVWIVCLLAFIFTAITSSRYEKRLQESDRLIRESLDVFSSFVDAKDPYTKGHSSRVAKYSKLIAQKLGFSAERCKQVYYVALLHDIGKCYVPDEILKKPSRLTNEEFDIIKTHTTHGAEMVENFSSIADIRDGALYHHERYDGKGYPTGCAGEEIPLIGRIICVADAYDAMNSNRVYRNKLTSDVIISELKSNSGTQFDPEIVNAFLSVLDEMGEEE